MKNIVLKCKKGSDIIIASFVVRVEEKEVSMEPQVVRITLNKREIDNIDPTIGVIDYILSHVRGYSCFDAHWINVLDKQGNVLFKLPNPLKLGMSDRCNLLSDDIAQELQKFTKRSLS